MVDEAVEKVDYEEMFNKVETALREGFLRLSYNEAFGHFELGGFWVSTPAQIHGKTLLEVVRQLQ